MLTRRKTPFVVIIVIAANNPVFVAYRLFIARHLHCPCISPRVRSL